MSILVFDTETTGMVVKQLPHPDAAQPDIVQLAAVLYADDGSVAQSFLTIVKPVQKAVEAGAAKVHGITAERAARDGVEAAEALGVLSRMVERADVLVAHNLAFDALVLRTAWHRALHGDFRDTVAGKRAFCTMRAMTPVCAILGPRARHKTDYKWPKLSECISFLFGETLEGAHDALVDVQACARVYFELKRRKALEGAS